MSEIRNETDYVSAPPEALTSYTKRWSRRLLYFSFLNFIIAGTLALFMRTDQGGGPALLGSAAGELGSAQVFGQLLTAHGLGMFVGWQFPFTYGLCSYIFPKYMQRKLYNEKLLPVIFWLFTVGFYLVWLSTLLGFGPGWYFLFPLPVNGGAGVWGSLEAGIFFGGMIITNLSLLVFAYNIFGTAFSSKYKDEYTSSPGKLNSLSAKFAASIGFDAYMPAAVRKRIVGYPAAAIAAMVTTIDMIVSAPPFFTLLADGFWESFKQPTFLNNLVAKNFLWINYHPIVYFSFFPLIGMYYTLIPIFANRTFSSQRWVRAPWPLLLITGVGVYSHHLFMDTVQPFALQLMSEGMSMTIAFASGISIFTLIALIWRSKYEWTLTAKFLIASIVGWIVGGVLGVEQGDPSTDIYLHNTYSVVAHFHFNALDGIILAGFGVLYWILPEISGKKWYSKSLGDIHFWGTCIGGFGLAGTFTILGFLGVPRREYSPIIAALPFTSSYQFWLVVAFFFAIVAGAAQIPFIWNIIKTLLSPTVRPLEPVPAAQRIPVPTPIARSVESDPEGVAFSNTAEPQTGTISQGGETLKSFGAVGVVSGADSDLISKADEMG